MSDSNSLDLSCFSFRKAFNTLKGPKKTKFRVFEKIKKKYNYFLFQPKAKFRLVDKYNFNGVPVHGFFFYLYVLRLSRTIKRRETFCFNLFQVER